MLVTLFPIVALVKLEQFWNALSPMLSTLFGIVTLVKLEQPLNALLTMLVTVNVCPSYQTGSGIIKFPSVSVRPTI